MQNVVAASKPHSRTDLSLEDMMARTPAVKEDLVREFFTRAGDGRSVEVGGSFSASPEQGRRLIQAFLEIESAEIRARILNLVVSLSRPPGRADQSQ
jgi:hypothetical protein